MTEPFPISLIIPVFNECTTIHGLIENIKRQTFPPEEIIIVDGGSTDGTAALAKKLTAGEKRYKIIEAGRAMPGKGRNIGASLSKNEWIAFTDAGVTQEKDWLELLVSTVKKNPGVEIVYGNVSPQTITFFEKCAAIAYVPPLKPNLIRSKSIASCLLKKYVWERIGGFPDFRASEDLIFMKNAVKIGFKTEYSYEAMIHWQISPTLWRTFKKLTLYSKHNVWAGLEKDWHYGVLKQYLLFFSFIALGIFYNPFWLLFVPIWISLRTAKRILRHKYEYGIKALIRPDYFVIIALIILTIDAATFIGWAQALLNKNKYKK